MKRLLVTIFLLATLSACTASFPLVEDTRPATPTPTELPVVEVPATPTPICEIKGNIRNGQKIYFTRESINYANVKVNGAAGEKWFCSEAEAQQAGFRKALK